MCLSSKILNIFGPIEEGVGRTPGVRVTGVGFSRRDDLGACVVGVGADFAANEGFGCAGVSESDCLNAGSCGSCPGAPAFCASDALETTKTPKIVTINVLIFIVQSPLKL